MGWRGSGAPRVGGVHCFCFMPMKRCSTPTPRYGSGDHVPRRHDIGGASPWWWWVFRDPLVRRSFIVHAAHARRSAGLSVRPRTRKTIERSPSTPHGVTHRKRIRRVQRVDKRTPRSFHARVLKDPVLAHDGGMANVVAPFGGTGTALLVGMDFKIKPEVVETGVAGGIGAGTVDPFRFDGGNPRGPSGGVGRNEGGPLPCKGGRRQEVTRRGPTHPRKDGVAHRTTDTRVGSRSRGPYMDRWVAVLNRPPRGPFPAISTRPRRVPVCFMWSGGNPGRTGITRRKSSRGTHRRAPTDHPRTWLNANQQALLYDFYHREPVVQVARRLILSTLLSGGLCVKSRDGHGATDAFDRLVQRHWVPFICTLYDHLMMFGLAVYTVVTVKEVFPSERDAAHAAAADHTDTRPAKRRYLRRNVRVPYVLPYGAYRVEVRHDAHAYLTYHVYRVTDALVTTDVAEAQDVFVLRSPAYSPSRTGLVRSPLLPLLPSHDFSRRLHEYALRTEYLRAHPPLITETRPEPTTATDAVAMEMFADGDVFQSKEDASYAKNRRHMNDFHRQQSMAAVLNGKHPKDGRITIDPFTGRSTRAQRERDVWEERVFVLPEGQTLSGHVQTQARPDLVDLERHRLDTVCAVMGVPKALVLQSKSASGVLQTGTGSAGAGGDVTYRTFMRSLESLATELQGHLTDVYETVYGPGHGVHITFPFLPVTQLEDLALLGELGLISRATLGSRMLAAMGLPASDLALQTSERAVLQMTRPEHKKPDPAPAS